MAKQNVTFIERHAEKIVVGVTGAILLVIAVLYLIGTPHKVEISGDSLGPQELYEKIREQADMTRQRMKQAAPQADEGDLTLAIPPSDNQTSPYDAEHLPKEFAVSFAPLSPAVPEIQGAERGKIRLASILPPVSVKVTAGYAYAKLPQQAVWAPNVSSPENDLSAVTKGHHWVVVTAAISRKDQRAKFEQAQYAVDRETLIVAGVQAEREERSPDGQWGEPTFVTGYSASVIPVRKTVALDQQDDGNVVAGDLAAIGEYRKQLDSIEGQSLVLRPSFQEWLEVPIAWQVPATVTAPDGSVINLAEYGAILEEKSDIRRPRAGVASAGQGIEGGSLPQANLSAAQLVKQAEQLIKKNEFLQAEILLTQVASLSDAPQLLKNKAQTMLRGIQPDLDRAKLEAARKERIASEINAIGPDNEPLWLTDITATPGKTYRYRVRLLAFNQYVGYVSQLENVEDATKVVLEGQWSDWSDPIQVMPASNLFFTSLLRDGAGGAKLEMREWFNGNWLTGTQDVEVGYPVLFTDNRHEFCYRHAIVADLIRRINYLKRSESRGQITYEAEPSGALVLITDDGQVEERVAVEDNHRKRELLREIELRRKQFEAFQGQDRPVMGTPAEAGRRAVPARRPAGASGLLERGLEN